jgi:digeranylgeranylglycerophospholipid reductase
MEEYDVVVVGAGPAGGTVSWFLSKKGLRVLMVEKKKAVGIPVTCAELLREKACQIVPLPDYVIDHQVLKKVIYQDYVKISETQLHAYMINREELDRYVVSQAVCKGAALSIGTEFLKFTRDQKKVKVLLKKRGILKEVCCTVLVGADGFGSRVARQAGFTGALQPGEHGITYQYYLSNVATEEDTIYFFRFVPYIGDGYAWIFPKRRGTANVGLGMRSRQGMSPREILDLFLSQNPVAHSKCQHAFPLSQSASVIHGSGPLKKTVDDNILVVGEAAGHVRTITGEGNYFAIMGGKIAAECCIKSFEEENFSKEGLKQYEVGWKKMFGRELTFSGEIGGK